MDEFSQRTAAIVNAMNQPCAAGQIISASCKAMGAPGASGSALLRFNFYNASGGLITTAESSYLTTADGAWHALSISVAAPALTTHFTLDFAVYASTNALPWYASEFACTNAAGGPVSALLTGDYIQIGYRLYKVLDAAKVDGDGHATLSIWPPLRDQPADGTTIITRNCKGLFRFKNNSGNKHSTNAGNYGLSGFAIKEAI